MDTPSQVLSPAPIAEREDEKHGPIYWIWTHTIGALGRAMRRHKLWSFFFFLFTLVFLFVFRAFWQPWLLFVRTHFFVIFFVGLIIAPFFWMLRRPSIVRTVLAYVGIVLMLLTTWKIGPPIHRYFSLYVRYQTLEIVDLKEMPITDHERIQPQNSIRTLSRKAISDSEGPTYPHFVRIDDTFRFTMAVEPKFSIRRLTEGTRRIFSVSATDPTPDFAATGQVDVNFDVSENLLWGRNTGTTIIRSFGPWRMFNYEPSDVFFLKDDDGHWVQVVSLIHWRGILFPQPEFGGVQVIEQVPERGDPEVVRMILRVIRGDGTWIRPEEIPNHPYLKGQNILAYEISRNVANAFRFQDGFFAPFPGRHIGDVRYPNLRGDMNEQPFVTFFKLDHPNGGSRTYHYFSLESFDVTNRGLNTSVLVPADGSKTLFALRHAKLRQSLTGVSGISDIVRASVKYYDWEHNLPAENRPVIRDINGQRRFYWLTTIVTRSDDVSADSLQNISKTEFVAGAVPDVSLTDAQTNEVHWVSPDPRNWVPELMGQQQGPTISQFRP